MVSLDLSLGRITRKSQMDEVARKYGASVFRAMASGHPVCLGALHIGQGLGAQPSLGSGQSQGVSYMESARKVSLGIFERRETFFWGVRVRRNMREI